ncbi:hypothetical protein QBC39DRAFT_338190 [Podospora conica]|nr:hypothetical protein QBC39DRAFT_338190 [Schizothecium conicum]
MAGKWHPLIPFPPSFPTQPVASVVIVMRRKRAMKRGSVVKRGKAGVTKTGEIQAVVRTKGTEVTEIQEKEAVPLRCCWGSGKSTERQRQTSCPRVSAPLPLPVLQSSVGFSVSARHRRDDPPASRRRPEVQFLEPGPMGYSQGGDSRAEGSRASKQRSRRLCYPPAVDGDGGTCGGSLVLLECVVSDAGVGPTREGLGSLGPRGLAVGLRCGSTVEMFGKGDVAATLRFRPNSEHVPR